MANEVAEAQRDYVGNATAKKQRDIDDASDVDPEVFTETYNQAAADATLAYSTDTSLATLTWQKATTLARKNFTTQSTAVDHTYTNAITDLDHAHQTQIVTANETRQHAHVDAEEDFFTAETVAQNLRRSDLAAADVLLRNAQQSARVNAHDDIDHAYQLPWTAYLVEAASTQLSIWNSLSAEYTNRAANRSLAETAYSSRIVAAYVTREKTLATAAKTQGLAENGAGKTAADSQANALRDFIINQATPAQTYADAVAQVAHDYAVAVAQAQRDYVFDDDSAQRTIDLDAASAQKQTDRTAKEAAWLSAEASGQADLHLDYATAERDWTLAIIAADVALATSRNNAEKAYRNEESGAYLESATTWANLDAAYVQYEANSATAATAQRTLEVAHTNAETAWRNGNLISSGMVSTAFANAGVVLASSEALNYAAGGGVGNPLPALESPVDLGLTDASSSSSDWWEWDADWWRTDTDDSSLTSILLDLLADYIGVSYWVDLAGVVTGSLLDWSYANYFSMVSAAPLPLTPASPAGVFSESVGMAPVGEGANYTNSEITAILGGLDPEAGEFWALHGTVQRTEVPERPIPIVPVADDLFSRDFGGDFWAWDPKNPDAQQSKAHQTSPLRRLNRTVDDGESSLEIAGELAGEASGQTGDTAMGQRLRRGDAEKLTPMEKLGFYLQGIDAQEGPSFLNRAGKIGLTVIRGEINARSGNLGDYAKGFATGFFIDGAWGNIEGIGSAISFGWSAMNQSWYNQARVITWGNEHIFENRFFDFEDERKFEADVQNAARTIFKVLNAVGTELGEEAHAHYHALKQGTPEELRSLGGKHRKRTAKPFRAGPLGAGCRATF